MTVDGVVNVDAWTSVTCPFSAAARFQFVGDCTDARFGCPLPSFSPCSKSCVLFRSYLRRFTVETKMKTGFYFLFYKYFLLLFAILLLEPIIVKNHVNKNKPIVYFYQPMGASNKYNTQFLKYFENIVLN